MAPEPPAGLRLIGYTTAPIIVAPYLSRRTRRELERRGLNYYSHAGPHLHIATDTVPVYAPIEQTEEG